MSKPETQTTIDNDLARLQSTIDQEFTADQLAALREQLRDSDERVRRLRAVPLGISDEPAPGFRPYRKEEKSR